MNDYIIFIAAIIAGYIIGKIDKNDERYTAILEQEIEQHKHQIKYLSELCKWHVEEKQKLKRENYIK